jgi:hypothetical protein
MEGRYSICAIFDGSIQVLVTEPDGSARSSPIFRGVDHARVWIERDKARSAARESLTVFAAPEGVEPARAAAIEYPHA